MEIDLLEDFVLFAPQTLHRISMSYKTTEVRSEYVRLHWTHGPTDVGATLLSGRLPYCAVTLTLSLCLRFSNEYVF